MELRLAGFSAQALEGRYMERCCQLVVFWATSPAFLEGNVLFGVFLLEPTLNLQTGTNSQTIASTWNSVFLLASLLTKQVGYQPKQIGAMRVT